MGWCSGTDIFDGVAKTVLSRKISEEDKKEILKSLAKQMYLHDWDCETDSEYYKDEFFRKEIFEIEDEE